MVSELILLTILECVLIALVAAIGHIVNARVIRSFSHHSWLGNFILDSVVGTLTLVTVVAICVTKCATIFVLAPFIIVLLARVNNANYYDREGWKTYIRPANVLVLLSLCIASMAFSVLFDLPASIDNDVLFYANISHALMDGGQENLFHYYNNFDDKFHGTAPYHYLELWMASVVQWLSSGISNMLVLKYVIYSFFKFYLFVGFASIISFYRELKFVDYLIIVGILLVPIEELLNTTSVGYPMFFSPLLRPNLLPYLFIFLPSLLAFHQNSPVVALMWLLFLPVISIATALAVIPSIVLLAFIGYYLGWFEKHKAIVLGSSSLVLAGLMALFYKITGTSVSLMIPFTAQDVLQKFVSIYKAIIGISIVNGGLFIGLLAAACYLMYTLVRVNRSVYQQLFFVGGTLFLCGFGAFQCLTFVENTYQFPYVAYSFLFLLVSVLVLIVAREAITKIVVLTFLIACTVVYREQLPVSGQLENAASLVEYNLSRRGIEQEDVKFLEKNKTRIVNGVFDYSLAQIRHVTPASRQFLTMPFSNYLGYLNGGVQLYPVVPEEIVYDTVGWRGHSYDKAINFNSQLEFYSGEYNPADFAMKLNASFVIRAGQIDGADYSCERFSIKFLDE